MIFDGVLHDRQKLVDTLLQLKQGPAPEEVHAIAAVATSHAVRIKRYRSD
jgi:putative transposase